MTPSTYRCACGYIAGAGADTAAGQFTDHLLEVFTPDDDRGTDGQVHAEAAAPASDGAGASAAWTCLCGVAAASAAGLDEHFLRVFVPADAVGRDGRRHVRAAP